VDQRIILDFVCHLATEFWWKELFHIAIRVSIASRIPMSDLSHYGGHYQ
jgi:hypothetical protein